MKKLLLLALLISSGLTFGQGWDLYWSGFTNDSRGISRLAVYDANTVWSIAYDGSQNGQDISAIGVTTDGGLTWTTYDPVSLPGAVNPGLSMIFPTSTSTAYIAAYKRSFGNGGVWKTTDTGATWAKVSSSTMYANAASFCNIVFFTDANNGFCQGDPINGEFEMYSTTDGGATWTPISGANIDDPLAGEYGYTGGITSAGGTIWFTTNKGRLYRSTDNGATWTAHQTPLTDFGGSADNGDVVFKDANEGWILRDNGELYHTTDAGDNWTLIGVNTFNYGGNIAYLPNGTLMISDADATNDHAGTAYSTDGGLTWTKIRLYSTDGGANYVFVAADAQIQFTALAFYDENTGFGGAFSHQKDPNDANDYDTGVYLYNPTATSQAIEENSNIEALSIYPNPVRNVLNVVSDKTGLDSVTVFDMTGKKVKSFNNLDVKKITINVQDLKQGFYLLKVVDGEGNEQTTKLIVK